MSLWPTNQFGQSEQGRPQPQNKPKRFINSFVNGSPKRSMQTSELRLEFFTVAQLRIPTMKHFMVSQILMGF